MKHTPSVVPITLIILFAVSLILPAMTSSSSVEASLSLQLAQNDDESNLLDLDEYEDEDEDEDEFTEDSTEQHPEMAAEDEEYDDEEEEEEETGEDFADEKAADTEKNSYDDDELQNSSEVPILRGCEACENPSAGKILIMVHPETSAQERTCIKPDGEIVIVNYTPNAITIEGDPRDPITPKPPVTVSPNREQHFYVGQAGLSVNLVIYEELGNNVRVKRRDLIFIILDCP